jgi:hypothetical protein
MPRAFDSFLARHRGDLRRIASRTSGEYTTDDLVSEAWLLGIELGRKRGWDMDLRDQDDTDTLLAWLHNKVVKYADKRSVSRSSLIAAGTRRAVSAPARLWHDC